MASQTTSQACLFSCEMRRDREGIIEVVCLKRGCGCGTGQSQERLNSDSLDPAVVERATGAFSAPIEMELNAH